MSERPYKDRPVIVVWDIFDRANDRIDSIEKERTRLEADLEKHEKIRDAARSELEARNEL